MPHISGSLPVNNHRACEGEARRYPASLRQLVWPDLRLKKGAHPGARGGGGGALLPSLNISTFVWQVLEFAIKRGAQECGWPFSGTYQNRLGATSGTRARKSSGGKQNLREVRLRLMTHRTRNAPPH